MDTRTVNALRALVARWEERAEEYYSGVGNNLLQITRGIQLSTCALELALLLDTDWSAVERIEQVRGLAYDPVLGSPERQIADAMGDS